MSTDHLNGQLTQAPALSVLLDSVEQEPVFKSSTMEIDVVQPSVLHALIQRQETQQEHISSTHFECLRISNPGEPTQIIIANSDFGVTQPIDRDSVLEQRKELNTLLFDTLEALPSPAAQDLHQVDHFTLLLNIVTRANMLKLNTSVPDDALRVYFENSQAAYTRYVSEFLEQFPSLSSIPCAVSLPGYSPLKHFSLLYAIEINELLDIHKTKPDSYLTVVDEATGAGFFIMTCASVLPRHVLARTRFLGTSLELADMSYAMQAARRYPIEVAWLLADINAPEHATKIRSFNNGNRVDLLVLNHVIEHLGQYSAEEYILAWLKATQTLIISVPFEGEHEISVSPHVRQFNTSSLLALGTSIERMSHASITCDGHFADGGLLIFRHVVEKHEDIIEVKSHVC